MAAWGFVMWNLPAVTTATPVYAGIMALAGPAAIACTVGLTTAAQRASPPAYLGLCVGTLETGGAVGQAVGAVGAGVLLDRVPLAGLLNGQATIYAVAAVLGATMVRSSRHGRPASGTPTASLVERARDQSAASITATDASIRRWARVSPARLVAMRFMA